MNTVCNKLKCTDCVQLRADRLRHLVMLRSVNEEVTETEVGLKLLFEALLRRLDMHDEERADILCGGELMYDLIESIGRFGGCSFVFDCFRQSFHAANLGQKHVQHALHQLPWCTVVRLCVGI